MRIYPVSPFGKGRGVPRLRIYLFSPFSRQGGCHTCASILSPPLVKGDRRGFFPLPPFEGGCPPCPAKKMWDMVSPLGERMKVRWGP